MKKLIFIAVALLSMVSCYNDSLIWDTIHNHETRISELELKCREMNVNISSLSQIIEALQENDYVTSISEVVEDGEVVGYKITFSKSGSVFIYHGINGKDGQDGEKGEDGANGSGGKDGYTPKIGVAKDIDGVYYWTLDGEWLLDENGEKIPTTGKDGQDGKDGVDGEDGEDGKDGTNGSDGEDGVDGKDGITPKLKIEDDYWYISYDDGISWHVLGEAVGEDGADGKDGIDGDSFFKGVTKDDNNVYLTLADGTVITIPLASSQLVNLIQSVTYVPVYKGGKAVFTKTYDENKGYAELDFIVNPSNVIAGLDTTWSDLLKFRCIATTTRAVNFIDLEIESYESDHDNGTFTIKVSGKALPDEFYRGKSSYSAALFIGDGSVASSFFELIAVESTDRPNMGLSTPYLSWGESVDKVKEYMSDFELDYSDNVTLVYSGLKSEHLISYEFEEEKLVAVAMFVKEDMSTLDEVLTLLEGYDVLHEYDGTRGEYASSELNTYAEVCKSEKSGETYWFIGWSEYVVDEGYNTITYLSSNNKAIPINTLYGFGADIVANRYDNATNIGTIIFTGPVTSIPEQAFSGATTLISINIPGSVTTIGEEAFSGCNKLMSVNVPDSVTAIGKSAFYECSSLTSVTIGDSVTTIGGNAFYKCSSLTSVYISDISAWCNISFSDSYSHPFCYANNHNLYLNNELVTDLTIPDSVTSIGSYAFYGCDSPTSVTIPDSVTTIGSSAFSGCDSLTSVTIPDSVTTIGSSAFYGCDSLTSVTIGDSVTTIGNSAFSHCDSLTSVTIPDSVTTIGERAFWDCDSLTSVNIGDSVTTIGDYAFNDCDSLTSVNIGDSVTTIGDYAFAWCDSLTSVTIGDSVTTIGSSAFSGCTSLTSVYCKATTPPAGGSKMFYDNPLERKIYVPTESVEAYKSADEWEAYADYITGYDFN